MQMRSLVLAASVVLWPALAAAELRHVEIKTLGMD
jgi:hypothetical protein